MTLARHGAIVLGAGVAGLSTALYLRRAGIDVVVIDPLPPAGGASFGNAGLLSPDTAVPIALPGMLRQVAGWLRDPLGPLSVQPGYLPRAALWLLRWIRAGRLQRVLEISDRPRIHARVRRQPGGNVLGNPAQQQTQDLGIEILGRRVEDRTGIRTEAGMRFGREWRVAAAACRRRRVRYRGKWFAAEQAREPTGPGLRRQSRYRGTRVPRRARPPGCSGFSWGGWCAARRPAARRQPDAVGQGAADGAPEPGEKAHTGPSGGLGRKTSGERCAWHRGGIIGKMPSMSRLIFPHPHRFPRHVARRSWGQHVCREAAPDPSGRSERLVGISEHPPAVPSCP